MSNSYKRLERKNLRYQYQPLVLESKRFNILLSIDPTLPLLIWIHYFLFVIFFQIWRERITRAFIEKIYISLWGLNRFNILFSIDPTLSLSIGTHYKITHMISSKRLKRKNNGNILVHRGNIKPIHYWQLR